MATIKSCTDLEQSKKLAEILPIESADMYYAYYHNPISGASYYEEYPIFHMPMNKSKSLPCWSLAALRNLLPPAIKPNKDSYLFESHNTFDNSWVYRYYNEDGASYLYCKNTNEVDACVDMIVGLGERNLL
jgi:hypothetical protein